ncbi:MAG: LytR C-terminal domain-containing protein [Chitinivibrionia bacterium]|nr:LytR C-terminal domain-containing protein [Chitinivibrionia bacterium]
MHREIIFALILLVIIVSAIVFGKSVEVYNRTQSITSKTTAGVPAKSVVYVYNGTNIGGLAKRVANVLRENGFDVRREDNMLEGNTPVNTYTKTLVISRNGEMEDAKKIADILGVKTPFFLISDTLTTTNEITIILGASSHKELK